MCLEPKIYVADLAAYNAGHLHGDWIDATQDIDDIQDAVNEMLTTSPVQDAEEYAIHDYEGFGEVSISEYEGLKSANEKALFIDEHGELGAAVLNHWSDDLAEAATALNENYSGQYTSVADYTQDLTEQTADIPQHLECYIDYERMGRDMEMSGDIYAIEITHNEVHIFWNR